MEPDYILFLLTFPAIIALGVITSKNDIKEGKIPNKWIGVSILYSLILNLGVFLFLVISGNGINLGYVSEFFLTIFFSLIIGYVMWNLGIWTAGDAKLLVAYTSLIPLSIYSYGNMKFFNFIILIINTVIPFFIFYSAITIFKSNFLKASKLVFQTFSYKNLLSLLIFIFSFSWILNLFFATFGIPSNYFIQIFFLFLLILVFERIMRLKILWLAIITSITRLIIDKSVYTIESCLFLFYLFLTFIIIRFFMLTLSYFALTKDIDLGLLKKGMIPAETFFLDGKKIRKEPIIFYTIFGYLFSKKKGQGSLFTTRPEGLTNKEIKKIWNACAKTNIEHIKIFQTIPFAPFIFSGAVFTIIFKGNMLIFLYFVIRSLI